MTPKADIFMRHFIDELKLQLYIAMRKCHNDSGKPANA
jgi:hypothetical protein